MSPKRSNTDMIKALEEKLEAAKAKEAEKATTRAAYLIEAIKTVDEKISKADASCDKAIKTATDLRDQRIAKLEAKRADLDAELADLAVDTASTSQLSFDEAEAEEV
jgi:flagellar hook-basal body complex protein FliE